MRITKQDMMLIAMLPAISKIDGGCGHCIGDFMDAVNKWFDTYRFEFDNTAKDEDATRHVQLMKDGKRLHGSVDIKADEGVE